ncbi:MAG: phosphate/phosphite/phosphonate ABC transporter substrate-binding protein [Anaerolineales bacterium]|nr:phosphate/phosphite/phosphonate ABC transporter substrate-binding protein [Anaerolineales bacterium]
MRKLTLLVIVILLVSSFVGPSFAQDGGTIADIAATNPDLGTLMLAISAADPSVAATLAGDGEYTVFAPTNEAFTTALEKLGVDAATVLGDTELLTSILLYHVVEGTVMYEDALGLDKAKVTTLEGEDLSVSVLDEFVGVNQANVIETDIVASNGVIHIIDDVLVPPSVLYGLVADATDLGTEDNPLTLLFIPSENAQEVQAGADELTSLLSEATGFVIDARVATDYAAAIEAMCGGEAEIGALNTFGYVLASGRGCANVGVVSVRFGTSFYAGQIVARADSGIESLEDITTDTVFCRPDPLSTSGWIIPSIAMRAAGIDVDTLSENVIDAGGHDGVVNAIYSGECQAGATFVDARSQVEDEHPDVRDVVLVIAESAPIPNDTLSFSSDVPYAMQLLLVDGLLNIANDEANVALLEQVYNWTSLARASDAFFDDFREQLDAAGVDVENLQ